MEESVLNSYYLRSCLFVLREDFFPDTLSYKAACEYIASPEGMKRFGTFGRDLAVTWLWDNVYSKLVK